MTAMVSEVEKLTYGVFAEEASELDPAYMPETVNTDGWVAGQEAFVYYHHRHSVFLTRVYQPIYQPI